jgi:hypothetical protein
LHHQGPFEAGEFFDSDGSPDPNINKKRTGK